MFRDGRMNNVPLNDNHKESCNAINHFKREKKSTQSFNKLIISIIFFISEHVHVNSYLYVCAYTRVKRRDSIPCQVSVNCKLPILSNLLGANNFDQLKVIGKRGYSNPNIKQNKQNRSSLEAIEQNARNQWCKTRLWSADVAITFPF